tara:strand:+ start:1083 stop:1268 length:186 start_codon:yes stop_codon:yes gene_type:complete
MKPNDGRITIKELISFMDDCVIKLRDASEDDAAFYFEQVSDHLRKDPVKGLNENVSRVLGL